MYIRNTEGTYYVNSPDQAVEFQVVYQSPYYYPTGVGEEYGIRYDDGKYEILNDELAMKFHEDNVEYINEDDFDTITKEYIENPLPENGTTVSENGEVLLVEDPTVDNFLTTAVKRALNAKKVPLSYYNNKVGKSHDINNMSKSINQGNVTNKRFESLADILDVEYCLILQDKRDSKLPMGKDVIVYTHGFDFEEDTLFSDQAKALVSKLKK